MLAIVLEQNNVLLGQYLPDPFLAQPFSVINSVQQTNDLKFGKKAQQEGAEIGAVKEKKTESDMVPKPYDDLFIEPAGDYDIVYADYNATLIMSLQRVSIGEALLPIALNYRRDILWKRGGEVTSPTVMLFITVLSTWEMTIVKEDDASTEVSSGKCYVIDEVFFFSCVTVGRGWQTIGDGAVFSNQ
uniref:Reverse transcriptase domain-containing protein n=1 Tax=Elaeophora elaphi TaxID=1147741 RepID=A0A0R3S6N0_9BILA